MPQEMFGSKHQRDKHKPALGITYVRLSSQEETGET
jgi:hypothetical protein